MIVDVDLYIYLCCLKVVFKVMIILNLVENVCFKGFEMVGMGDIFNLNWEKEFFKYIKKVDEGIYERNGIRFFFMIEVEDI